MDYIMDVVGQESIWGYINAAILKEIWLRLKLGSRRVCQQEREEWWAFIYMEWGDNMCYIEQGQKWIMRVEVSEAIHLKLGKIKGKLKRSTKLSFVLFRILN